MIDETLKERGNRYGSFPMNAIVTQGLVEHLRMGTNWETMEPYQKEALTMICHKMSRIVNGDPKYVDSIDDIIGYATLYKRELQ